MGTGQSVGVLPFALTPLPVAQGRPDSVRMTGFEGVQISIVEYGRFHPGTVFTLGATCGGLKNRDPVGI
jgi:hypothetical protein